MFNDYTVGGSFRRPRSYIWVIGAALLEPFLYHPFTVIFSLKGYFNYIFNRQAVWGTMSRKGFSQDENGNKTEPAPATAAAAAQDKKVGKP